MREQIDFISGILLVSENPARLATFYRDTIGLALEEEQHGETLPHWGCDLGDIHFAIHPIEDFPDHQHGVGAVKLAFNVFEIKSVANELTTRGVVLLYPIRDTGFFLSTAVLDPDANFIEFTEMSAPWFDHLAERRAGEHDVIDRWKRHKAADAT